MRLRHIVADHFLGALKEIERRAQNNILVFSDVLTERLGHVVLSFKNAGSCIL